MNPRIDLTGVRSGRLIAQTYMGEGRWSCLCDCGGVAAVTTTHLRQRRTLSCGCFQREKTADLTRTHGRRHTPEYVAWCAMKHRCLNPRASQFRHYGGRGITICQRWIDSFEAFFADMGEKPSRVFSLDRIDNEGPYEPDNCRWADKSTQSSNSRHARLITFNGTTDTVSGWARRRDMPMKALSSRLKRGWGVGRALTTPLR